MGTTSERQILASHLHRFLRKDLPLVDEPLSIYELIAHHLMRLGYMRTKARSEAEGILRSHVLSYTDSHDERTVAVCICGAEVLGLDEGDTQSELALMASHQADLLYGTDTA